MTASFGSSAHNRATAEDYGDAVDQLRGPMQIRGGDEHDGPTGFPEAIETSPVTAQLSGFGMPDAVVLDGHLPLRPGEVDPCHESALVEDAELGHRTRQAAGSDQQAQAGLLR